MKLTELDLQNWGPHLERKITFDPNARTIAILAGNDVGKSWVINAIGFIFSSGKNEYGDVNAIYDNGPVANLGLKFEHEGIVHHIQKEITRKDVKSENERLKINEMGANTNDYEAFFSDKLRIQSPKIWLPLCIALQGQIDHFLKAKKSDREESFRQLKELHRIDRWKEHLHAILLQNQNSISQDIGKAKQKSQDLQKKRELLQKEKTEKEDQLKALIDLHGDIKVGEESSKALEKLVDEGRRLDLEIDHETQNIQIYKTQVQQLEKDLEENKKAQVQLQEATKSLEEIEQKLKVKQNQKVKSQLIDLEEKIRDQRKNLEETDKNTKMSPEEIQEIDKYSKEAERTKGKIEILEEQVTSEENLEDKKKDLEENFKEIEKEEETKAKAQIEWEKATYPAQKILKQEQTLLAQETDVKIILEKLNNKENTLKEEEKIQCLPIGEEETKVLRKRFFAQLLENPPKTGECQCPLCETGLKGEIWENPTKIQELFEKYRDAQPREIHQETGRNFNVEISEIQKATKSLQMAQSFILPTLLQDKSKISTKEIQKKIEKLEKEQSTRKELQILKRNLEDTLTALKLYGYTVESAKTLVFTYGKNKENKKKIEESIQKVLQEINEKKLEINNNPIEDRIVEETIEELLKLKGETNQVIHVTKTRTQTFEKKQGEFLQIQTKLEESQKKSLKMKETREAVLLKKENILGKYYTREDEQAYLDTWEKIGKESTILLEKLKNLPTLLQSLICEEKETEHAWKTLETQENIMNQAKEAEAFLDYRQAPRQLLRETIDEIFRETNRIAQGFELDMELIQPKPMEFFVKQKRHGKWIDQSASRLGFGKSSILGICLRLASLNLLVPNENFLILDEPTTSIENRRKGRLREFFAQIAQGEYTGNNKTQIIMAEHDQDVIASCDQIINLQT